MVLTVLFANRERSDAKGGTVHKKDYFMLFITICLFVYIVLHFFKQFISRISHKTY